MPEQSLVQMLCYLLECLLTPENTPADCPKELHELYFVFATVWAFGGAMFQDQVSIFVSVCCVCVRCLCPFIYLMRRGAR